MFVQASLVFPSLANHEDIGTGSAAEHIISDAALVTERFFSQRLSGLDSLDNGSLFLGSFEKTIDSNHISSWILIISYSIKLIRQVMAPSGWNSMVLEVAGTRTVSP